MGQPIHLPTTGSDVQPVRDNKEAIKRAKG
jgi:hypothetical protein